MFVPRRASRARPGYSLIELVVVLMVLAIVAGLTVSIVDWLRRSADKASASNIMGSLLSNIQLYRTTYGNYPDQYDSLIDDAASTLYDKLHSELKGSRLTLDTGLTQGELNSLNSVGITTVFHHKDQPSVNVGNSAITFSKLAANTQLAVLNDPEVIDSIFPPLAGGVSGSGQDKTKVKLVVFGFGPKNTAIGKTIVAPPIYSGVGDPSAIYPRFAVVFAVFADGSPAQLKAVLDSKGDFLNEELTEFYQSTPK